MSKTALAQSGWGINSYCYFFLELHVVQMAVCAEIQIIKINTILISILTLKSFYTSRLACFNTNDPSSSLYRTVFQCGQASKKIHTAARHAGQVTCKIHLPCSNSYLPCIFVWCLLPIDKKGKMRFCWHLVFSGYFMLFWY